MRVWPAETHTLMKIHEYQAKAILARHGVPVPLGEVVFSAADAALVATRLGGGVVVVKAQIHAGGRGKGGGVKVVKDRDAAQQAAKGMIGMRLVTIQTGAAGQVVQRVLVEQGLKIKRELYLGLVLDRATERPVLMASQEGGVEIEKVAEETPDRIHKEFIHPGAGLSAFQTRKLAFALGLEGPQIAQASKLMTSLYEAFVATDASLIEINPLIVTEDGNLLALDAKMTFDDNALYRHPDLKELRDAAEEEPLEVEASKFSLNYIKLDGTIGCMVNGAGLAMATMDIIKLAGGEPELSGRRRRRQRRADPERVQDSDVGHQREGRPHQHFRRHPALRRARRRGHCGRQGTGCPGADRHPDGGHQRRAGEADAQGERSQLHDCRHDERSGREGRRAREIAPIWLY